MPMCALLAVCAACGGGNPTFATGTATVSAPINGVTMTPQDAISVVFQSGSNSLAEVFISSFPTACSKINAHQEPKNSQAVVIALGNRSSTTAIVAPSVTGDYPVYLASDHSHIGVQASLQFLVSDQNCVLVTQLDASAGTVTLTRIDANGYAGTYNVTFGTSTVTGSFSSAQCAPLANPTTTCI